MAVQYQFVVDQAYFRTGYQRWRRQRRQLAVASLLKWFGGITLAVCGGVLLVQGRTLLALGCWAYCGLVAASGRVFAGLTARRHRRIPQESAPATVTLSPAGISAATSTSQSTETWPSDSRACVFDDGILLFSNPRQYRWLPDAAIIAGTPEVARELVQQHVGKVQRPR